MMKITPRILAGAVAAVGLLTMTTSALAQVQRMAYYLTEMNLSDAHVVHWDASAGRAKETDGYWTRSGSYTRDESGDRILTYDTPFTITRVIIDPECNRLATARIDQTQAIYRDLDQRPRTGKSLIGATGTRTWIDGCRPGVVEPYVKEFGDFSYQRQSMSIAADVTDLMVGTRLAGLSEDPISYLPDGEVWYSGLDQDTVHFAGLPGMATFERSQQSHPARLGLNSWVVIDLPSGPRAYRRMATDARTGREIWLVGGLQGNELQWVAQTNMVKPVDGASFGSDEDVARVWRSSFRANILFGFKLFSDHTANRCTKTPGNPWYCITTVNWALDLGQVNITTLSGSRTSVRTWEPLVRNDNKQWVFETEVYKNPDGSTSPFIARRVNYYEDKGPATSSR